jgi:hypothetical protein
MRIRCWALRYAQIIGCHVSLLLALLLLLLQAIVSEYGVASGAATLAVNCVSTGAASALEQGAACHV